jgi:tetratricopeptide (TPR) repeat protein
VSEESERVISGSEGGGAGIDPTAVALALDGASRERADSFLAKQEALIAAQLHHLHEQLEQIHLDVWEKRLGVMLRVATMAVGLAVAGALGFMVWHASESNGLLIEPFSVPADLAGRGLTGQVLSAKLLDRLVAMQAQTSSQRASQSYTNSWDEKGIKLDVPESGVSLTELDQFLREKLGRDTHVTGELVHTPSGLSLTARAGLNGADTISGPDTDMDALVQRLAESVYRMTQPYRYAVYLISHDRSAEAVPVFSALAKTGPGQDRFWAFTGWANAVRDSSGEVEARRLLKKSVALAPEFPVAQFNIAWGESYDGHMELALRDFRQAMSFLLGRGRQYVRPELVPVLQKLLQAQIDLNLGDFRAAVADQKEVIDRGIPGRWGLAADLAHAQGGMHDIAGARDTMADPVQDSGQAPGLAELDRIRGMMLVDWEAQDWNALLSRTGSVRLLLEKYPGMRSYLPTMIVPLVTYAEARLGRTNEADEQASAMPADCYDCLRTRALIAVAASQPGRADNLFAEAVQLAPSIPFAYFDWGQSFLIRGKPDAAIAQFKIANQQGPHFADPLEGWGEALMAKNQSHLALAKFAEAEKYAPNWGRLHLKWGEALVYAGKRDDAKAQFARAAALDLTPSEKSELTSADRKAP